MVSSSPLWWIKNAMSPSFVQSSSNRARLGRRRRFRCARRGGRGCIDRHRNRRRWVGVGVAEGVEELGVSGWEDWGYGGCFVGGIGRWVRQPENGVEVVSGCFFLGGGLGNGLVFVYKGLELYKRRAQRSCTPYGLVFRLLLGLRQPENNFRCCFRFARFQAAYSIKPFRYQPKMSLPMMPCGWYLVVSVALCLLDVRAMFVVVMMFIMRFRFLEK